MPGLPLTLRATTASGPRLARNSALTRRVKRSTSNGSQRSPGSRGSIRLREFALVTGAVTVLVIVFLLVNLLVDLLYAALDPRIRYD